MNGSGNRADVLGGSCGALPQVQLFDAMTGVTDRFDIDVAIPAFSLAPPTTTSIHSRYGLPLKPFPGSASPLPLPSPTRERHVGGIAV
jgi:hypothetical protein